MTQNSTIIIKDWEKLDKGFLTVCEGVAQTLGGEGKLALLDDNDKIPIVTKDGVSVAMRMQMSDPIENFGALQAVQAASMTLKKSGDSTTTTLVFAKSFLENFKRKNFNKAVERGINKAVEETTEHIAELATKTDRDTLKRIAITSCNNDEELGNLIIEAFDEVGFDGMVEVSENTSIEKTNLKKEQGMIILNEGYATPFFINQNEKAVFEADDVSFGFFEVYSDHPDIMEFVKNFYSNRNLKDPLVIVTERQVTELKDRIVSLKKSGVNICYVGLNANTEFENVLLLNDMADFTSGEVYHPDHVKRDKGVLQLLPGKASKAVIESNQIVISVKETPQKINDVVLSLKAKKERTNNEEKRLKRLIGKSCIIEVGGVSPNDLRERKDRVDDALASVKSAIAEGYIAGGGSALVYISKNLLNTEFEREEEQQGYDLVKKVLLSPFKQILLNANRKQSKKEIKDKKNRIIGRDYMQHSIAEYGVGYNATKDEVVNLIDDGIIDSAKSIRIALESAKEASIKMFNIAVIVLFPETARRNKN